MASAAACLENKPAPPVLTLAAPTDPEAELLAPVIGPLNSLLTMLAAEQKRTTDVQTEHNRMLLSLCDRLATQTKMDEEEEEVSEMLSHSAVLTDIISQQRKGNDALKQALSETQRALKASLQREKDKDEEIVNLRKRLESTSEEAMIIRSRSTKLEEELQMSQLVKNAALRQAGNAQPTFDLEAHEHEKHRAAEMEERYNLMMQGVLNKSNQLLSGISDDVSCSMAAMQEQQALVQNIAHGL
jgi:predicted RNase H-like nuclease (RuvC/YqgF family)